MNAYEVKALQQLGIRVGLLGCVMLDVAPVQPPAAVQPGWAYLSTHPERTWIKGLTAGDHITLLYGLLYNANTIRPAIDEVLEGWQPGPIIVESVGAFPSTFADEPYACIVGHIKVTDELADAHARLSLLPHIDTHPQYKPHLTLGYVQQPHEAKAIKAYRDVVGSELTARGLNYGDRNRP